MTYKIATKNGVYFGYGVGQDISFSDKTVTIETFNNEADFNARLQQLGVSK